MIREEEIFYWAFGGAILMGVPALVNFSSPLLFLLGSVVITPPQIFLGNIRHGARQNTIRLYASIVMIYSSVAIGYTLHYLETAGYLGGDSREIWMEVITCAGAICCPPLCFTLIYEPDQPLQPQPEQPQPNRVAAEEQGATLWETARRSKECRAAALAYGSYYALVLCTVIAAVGADWVGLVPVESSLVYMLAAAACSTFYAFLLNKFTPVLNTHRTSKIFYFFILPSVLVIIGVSLASDADMTKLTEYLSWSRKYVYVSTLPAAIRKTFGGAEWILN